jgi:serine/threonine protein kinase/Tol biopolymer transport system component
MDTPSRELLSHLYHAVLKRSPEERSAFLKDACKGDLALQQELESLLRYDAPAADFLERPAAGMVVNERLPAAEAVSRRVGPYKIVSLLGIGGMGEVYRARDLKLGRDVAIKILPAHLTTDPERRARFAREARLLATLNHPHIGAIYGLEEAEDLTALVLELVEGQTLAERLERGPLALSEALTIARQLGEALQASHHKGIVHRDLKPANVVLQGTSGSTSKDLHAKVLDFGLAKPFVVPGDGAPTQLAWSLDGTAEGRILGTPAYMSPEQARGLPVDKRTDIWAFGCVLYEMLSGRRPFGGDTVTDTLARILEHEPEWEALPAGTPLSIRTLLQRCLRKDPAKRLHDIADALIELEDTAAGTARSQASAAPVETPTASRRVIVTLAACLSVLLASGVWWVIRHPPARNQVVDGQVTQRNQQRLTFAPGLQTDLTWSPDGRFIAYASDQAGNFDIWVQSVTGGNAVQVTRSVEQDRQPAWSRDNKLVYRSERGGGGLYVVSALGGSEHQLATFGVRPKWTADGESVLFASTDSFNIVPKFYMVGLDGRQPRQVLRRFTERLLTMGAWSLHPDGRRMSAIATARTHEQGLFTVSLSDDSPVLSKDHMNVRRQQALAAGLSSFVWSPSGSAIYVEALEQSKTDLWRFAVDPTTLDLLRAERLTTGGGVHTDPVLSPDGTRLAFTNQTQSVRLWSFPLDGSAGRITGEGTPITEEGARALTSDLSPDGRRLAYVLAREGGRQEELWVVDLLTNQKQVLTADEALRTGYWSRDGTRLAYEVFRWTDKTQTQGETAVKIRTVDGGDEQQVTTFTKFLRGGVGGGWRSLLMIPTDWSLDGERLLANSDQVTPPRYSLYWLPLAAAPQAERHATLVASDPRYNVWQARLSPNGRWIAFMAQNREEGQTATIAVIPNAKTASSQWTHLTDAGGWADKPRWSPDGKLLYFIVRQGTFYNVWVVRFEPETGKPIGSAFQVTRFDSQRRQFSTRLSTAELSVSSTRLVLPVMETTGNIWMLDNADR